MHPHAPLCIVSELSGSKEQNTLMNIMKYNCELNSGSHECCVLKFTQTTNGVSPLTCSLSCRSQLVMAGKIADGPPTLATTYAGYACCLGLQPVKYL